MHSVNVPIGSTRKENGNPLQYSCLGNSMDRGALWATVHGVAKCDITEYTAHIMYFMFEISTPILKSKRI